MFTEEQIKAIELSILSYSGYMGVQSIRDKVIAELTRPEWIPEVGQVVMYECAIPERSYFTVFKELDAPHEFHPLTLTEHGPDVRAMQDALKRIGEEVGAVEYWRDEPDGVAGFVRRILKAHEISD
jgi:hypothetical protein